MSFYLLNVEMPSLVIRLVPKIRKASLTNRALVWSRTSMNALVNIHVKFLREHLSADSALITHCMLEKSSSLLSEAGQVDLAYFDAILGPSGFTHASLCIEYFFFEEFQFMFLNLMKLEPLLPGVGLPAARLAALEDLIEFPLLHD